MWGWPDNFAAYVNFPNHVHFLHDMGVYHLGVALGLLIALVKRDAIFVVMVAFAAINVLHAFNHVLDRDLGGHPSDPYLIGVQASLAGAGAVLRAYQLRAQQRRADLPRPAARTRRTQREVIPLSQRGVAGLRESRQARWWTSPRLRLDRRASAVQGSRLAERASAVDRR
jgi:hypothetical protein